jgi:Fe-S-cluster containining protein
MTKNDLNLSENDLIFFNDGYQLAQNAVAEGLNSKTLFAAIESLYAAIDGLNDSVVALASRQNIKVDCFNGCHWCCHQAVFANSYELHYLSEKVKLTFPQIKLEQLIERNSEKLDQTSALTNEDILRFKFPCALLVNGSCSAYSARPMACRIYLSTKLETCLEFFHHPENETNYPALIEFPLRAGQMMNEGFREALKENGVETAEFRLEEGLDITLKNNISYF